MGWEARLNKERRGGMDFGPPSTVKVAYTDGEIDEFTCVRWSVNQFMFMFQHTERGVINLPFHNVKHIDIKQIPMEEDPRDKENEDLN